MEWKVYECYFGAFGYYGIFSDGSDGPADKDFLDCDWVAYKETLPLFKASFLDKGDMIYDYVPWYCNYYEEDPYVPVDADKREI